MKPAFSNPDESPEPVTPGVTDLDRAAARLLRFKNPEPMWEAMDCPEWFDEHDERL